MVTLILLALQLSIWVAVFLTGDTASWTSLLLVPSEFRPLALLTAPFVHLTMLHLLMNLLLLGVLGPPLERSLGALPFLLLYLSAAAFGGLVHLAWTLLFTTDVHTPASGSSGAVAGLMGAYAVRFSHRSLRLPGVGRAQLPVPAALMLWVIAEVVQGVATVLRDEWLAAGHWAHVGGFFFGLTVTQAMGVARTVQAERSLADAQEGKLTSDRAWQVLRELLERRRTDPSEIDGLLIAAGEVPGIRDRLCDWLEEQVGAGRLETALPVYRQARRRWGELSLSAGCRFALGCRLAEQREWALAVATLVEAGRVDPHPDCAAAALFRAGEITARALADIPRARALFDAAAARHPEGDWVRRAEAFLGSLRPDGDGKAAGRR